MPGSEPQDDAPRIGLIARPWRIVGFLAVTTLVAAAAFWLGGTFATPEQVAVDATDDRIPVAVAVESRVVGETTTVQGTVRAGLTMDVEAVRPARAARAVVTSVISPRGTTVTARSVLAVVSDRPMIVLPLAIPLYRDLVAGDEGDDVSRLQSALNDAGFDVSETGVVDWETQEAIRDLYDGAGFDAPGGTGDSSYVDLQELVQIPGGSAVVTDIAAAGSVLGATTVPAPRPDAATPAPTTAAPVETNSDAGPGTPSGEVLATLQIRPNTITARANVLQISAFPVGASVIVRGAGGTDITCPVADIGSFTSDATTGGGYDVTLTIPDEHQAGLTVGQSVTATIAAGGEPATAVPLIAIHQEAGATWVRPAAPSDTETPPAPIEISVIRQADGWAAIADTTELPVGTMVQVGP